MIVGILSDTHDKIEPTRAALARLAEAGAKQVIHCGDVGGEKILDQLAGLSATLVWGNNDLDRRALARYAATLGITVGDPFADLTVDGKRFAVTHGDDGPLLKRLLESKTYDYVLTGHTHVARDVRAGLTRWINPGALHRVGRKTVATLDVARDVLTMWPVDGGRERSSE